MWVRSFLLVGVAILLAGCPKSTPPVISYFGAKESSRIKPHTGIDYGLPIGTPILAAADGCVSWISNGGNDAAGGNGISLSHSYLMKTQYWHLNTILVEERQCVQRGDVIALSGVSGKPLALSTKGMLPHLHFSVLYEGSR